MKIAILSDIHGNDGALIAVLNELEKFNIDKLLLLGDYVGYYYNVDIVLELINRYDNVMIKGNHEMMMGECLHSSEKLLEYSNKYGHGFQCAKKKLSDSQISSLIGLSDRLELQIDGIRIMMCHGSPWDACEYIYPDTPEGIKKQCLKNNADFVFIGHSHYPFLYKHDNKVLMNVGSVGQNRDVGGIANWGFLDTCQNKYCIRETPYDFRPLLNQIKKINPEHKYLVNVLNRNTMGNLYEKY